MGNHYRPLRQQRGGRGVIRQTSGAETKPLTRGVFSFTNIPGKLTDPSLDIDAGYCYNYLVTKKGTKKCHHE